ncbi:MAG: O-antigen ligase family protein [Oscillospiraceae bacterium]|nr:O-antigen ligase family protein [Oscillospiraceae bacterium]
MKTKLKNRISPLERICAVWFCLLGTALPLAMHDAYFDITRTKAIVGWALSGALLLGWALWLLLGRKGGKAASFALSDLLFSLFVLCHLLSTLFFRPFSEAFFAPDNRFQGLLCFALYGPVFLILRRGGRFGAPVRFALLLGGAAAALIGAAEIFGADPLGLRAVTPAVEQPRFLSTVGNVSFFGALCVLILPIAAWYALSAKDLRAALPYALCAMLALCGGMAARTEGFVLGALAFFAALPLFSRHVTALRRIPLLWALAALAAFGFSLAMERWARYRPSELTRLLCAPVPMLALAALAAAAFVLLRKRMDLTVLRVRKVYGILFWAAAAAAVLFLILANTLWRDSLPDPIASVAVFSPSWGTDRGAEWAYFFRMFREAPLLRKLIGSGAGSLAAWDRAHPLFSDAITDSAHNEYLHYLITGGVIGLGSYLALLVCALRKALREPSRGRTAAALGCFAYAVQAAVNLAQPFTTPLFFALLALIFSDGFAEDGEEKTGPLPYVALCALTLILLIAAVPR